MSTNYYNYLLYIYIFLPIIIFEKIRLELKIHFYNQKIVDKV